MIPVNQTVHYKNGCVDPSIAERLNGIKRGLARAKKPETIFRLTADYTSLVSEWLVDTTQLPCGDF